MGLVVVGVVLFALAAGLWWGGTLAERKRQVLLATETVTCGDLAATFDAVTAELGSTTFGRVVEVCGRARPGPVALVAPLSDRPCVWYRSTITEHYREYEWRGSEKNNDRHRELVDKSRTVSDETSSDAFAIDDGSGSVLVAVDDAKIDVPEQVMDRRVQGDDSGWANRFSVNIGPFSLTGSGEGTTGYQHREWIVAVDATVFAIGEAQRDGSGGGLRLGKPRDKAAPFIVSTRDEAAVQNSASNSARAFQIGTIVAAVAGAGAVIAGLVS